MAEYKGIKGFKVQSLASDPSGPEGQVWYNTATDALKYQAVAAGAWASGNALNTGRAMGAGLGTQTAALYGGGDKPTDRDYTESYDGTSWTEVADKTDAVYSFAGFFGTQTAAITAGGKSPPSIPVSNQSESWDGTSWTAASDLQTGVKDSASGAGVQTAGIIAAGYISGDTAISQTWDGTSWATANSVNTARSSVGRCGITKDTAVICGGNLAPKALTEVYDGTSWSEKADLTSGRANLGGGGPSTSGLVFGGLEPATVAKTEQWDGTSWTEVADLGTALWDVGGCSNASATLQLQFGGDPGGSTNTEEWNGAPLTVKTVTVS